MSAAESAPLTRAMLDAYFAGRGHDVVVQRLRQIGGGASRETWLVELDRATGELPRVLLIRKDTPDGATVPTSLDREYAVLRGLSREGVPVPAPYWFEADPGVFGTPFYVRQGFEGTSDQSSFSGAAARRLAVGLAEALAVLHRTDPAAVAIPGEPVPATTDEALQAEIEKWYARWLERTHEPAPFLREVTWWLRRNRPATTEPPVVVWGDVGVANTICAPDGSVLALSDFELAGLGDPMRDLASALWRGVALLAGRETFLDAYVAAGGTQVVEERLGYYDVFFNWQVALFSHSAARQGRSGRHRSLHPPLLQIWVHTMNLHKAGRRIGV